MKLQFGCGENKLDGWQNYDSDVDITKPLPFPDSQAELILIEHCLEHVDCGEALRFCEESRRILKPGGVLRICVPTLGRILNKDWARDLIVNHSHRQLFCLETLMQMLWVAGFDRIHVTERKECDGHWKVIGQEKDDAETLRVEAVK